MAKRNKTGTFQALYNLLLSLVEKRDVELLNDFQLKNKVTLIALNTQLEELFEKHVVKTGETFPLKKVTWWKFWEKKFNYKYHSKDDEKKFYIGWHKMMKKPITIYY